MLKSFDVTELLLVDFLRSMILYTLYHVLNFVFPFYSFLFYVFTFSGVCIIIIIIIIIIWQ